MCGIIGIASNKLVASNIIQSLKKLEYRGYDSAGIATIVNGEINEKKMYWESRKFGKNIVQESIKGIFGYRSCKMGNPWNTKSN